MLLSNSLYISALCGDGPITDAQLLALQDIARDGLSVALSTRVQDFLRGYASHANPSVSRQTPHVRFTTPDVECPGTVIAEPSPSRSGASSTDDESATVYASVADTVPSTGIPSASTPAQGPRLRSTTQLKALVGGGVLLAGVLASFKVPALCEPFGLCSSSSKSDQLNPDQSKGNSGGATKAVLGESSPAEPEGNGTTQPFVTPPPDPGARVSEARLPPSTPRQPISQPAYQPSYQRPQASEPSPPSAPLREEALW